MSHIRYRSCCDEIVTTLTRAQLALKHRQNKSQRQRIIVFTCSTIAEDQATLIKLAKKMKKNNIAIDFVAFGDLDPTTTSKLQAFNENIKSSNTGGEGGSHLEIVQPGPSLLSDHLLSTPILAGEGIAGQGVAGAGDMGDFAGADGGAGGAGGSGFEFGFDPSADPELALALRMSMADEEARVEKEKQAQGAKDGEKLEGIPEEAGKAEASGQGEQEPLLGKDGEPSVSKGVEDDKDDGQGKKEGEGSGDKMDTS